MEASLAGSFFKANGSLTAKRDVLLINMPFKNSFSPSIGLGLLKGAIAPVGISARTLEFHLLFADMIGEDAYKTIENDTYPEHLVGEWLFSPSLFDREDDEDFEEFFSAILHARNIDIPDRTLYPEELLTKIRAAIIAARPKVNEFMDKCVDIVLAHQPKLVAFTSMFEQHIASLALAKRIKAREPGCFVLFGGSNCEGPMGAETFRQFLFIDGLVSGEGDLVFPRIVQSILNAQSIPAISGVLSRRRKELPLVNSSLQNTPLIENLDTLPVPDYDDYFEQLAASSLALKKKPLLLFETSRGCWWGEKQHCTFCGLNGSTMTYRSKSADRAINELIYLTNRYPGYGVNAVDNILDMRYFNTFVKTLAEGNYSFGLFYEVKANLKKEQLRLLKSARIETIQPGIESLSDNVLRIMKKGVSALQNIQFLKWCAELDIKPIYNIIWGFPGETADDYEETIRLIPLLTHLNPPVGSGTIRIDRFSPNFTKHQELGFGKLTPFPAYEFVYPFESKILSNLAYYFTPEHEHTKPALTTRLTGEIKTWKDAYGNSELFFMDKGSQLLVWDFRPAAKEPLIILDEYARLAYLACDEASSVSQIQDYWRKNYTLPLDEIRLNDLLDTLVGRSMMLRSGGQYLSLAHQKNPNRLKQPNVAAEVH